MRRDERQQFGPEPSQATWPDAVTCGQRRGVLRPAAGELEQGPIVRHEERGHAVRRCDLTSPFAEPREQDGLRLVVGSMCGTEGAGELWEER